MLSAVRAGYAMKQPFLAVDNWRVRCAVAAQMSAIELLPWDASEAEQEALFSAAAMMTIQSEIRRSGRARTPCVETSGLLFGEIDTAHREIWVDKATGPPPDSELPVQPIPERTLSGDDQPCPRPVLRHSELRCG